MPSLSDLMHWFQVVLKQEAEEYISFKATIKSRTDAFCFKSGALLWIMQEFSFPGSILTQQFYLYCLKEASFSDR